MTHQPDRKAIAELWPRRLGHNPGLGAIERAFNLLIHPELQSCYDALLRDADSPALFLYGGGGQCLVSGEQADDGQTFFVRQLLGYFPSRSCRSAGDPIWNQWKHLVGTKIGASAPS